MINKYGATVSQAVLSIASVLLATFGHTHAIVMVVVLAICAMAWANLADIAFGGWGETVAFLEEKHGRRGQS